MIDDPCLVDPELPPELVELGLDGSDASLEFRKLSLCLLSRHSGLLRLASNLLICKGLSDSRDAFETAAAKLARFMLTSGSRPGGSLPVLKVSAMQERNIDMTIPEFKRGTVRANGLEFHYLEAGKGPLALCYHGFPDSPYTYRHLLPALAEAGYRAVAPFIRGFAPTEVPPDRRHIHTSLMAADQNALHEALGGSGDAILLAHDWGAVGAYGAAGKAPDRWKKCVIMNIPPFQIFGKNLFSYAQIKKSFYFWFFQMQEVSGDVVSANNFEFIDNIWADWSPGYDASEDLPLVKECLRNPAHFQTAMGYYWGQFDPVRFGSPVWLEEQEAAWGYSLTQPTLYLHGSQDGCHGLDKEQVQSVLNYVGKGSEAELIDGVGHFMPLQKPAEINARILRFLKKS